MTLTKLRAKTTLTLEEMAAFNAYKSVKAAPVQVPGMYSVELNGVTSRWKLNEETETWNLVSLH
jgi:hypothetical protein